ncbi:MAG: ABC transporter ATP-binding protein [Alphaproteobacteria bacterium]|nr:ABC transporter ATP-binding protein [Alphaproteobacteria bacterium]
MAGVKGQAVPGAPAWGERGTTGVSFADALAFKGVYCQLAGKPVLKGVDLAIRPREIVCLLGQSGSGKSTILRAAAGLLNIEGGEITINSRVVSAPGITVAPEKRGLGLMFQDFALFPHLTLLDNAAFGLRNLGRREARNQAAQALKRVGLETRADDYPAALSGGEQQRLALARAVAPRPGILLMDEPFSSLDARLRQAVRAETLAVLRETGATCVIVTHDPEEAMLLGDRIALLRAGRIVQICSAHDIYNHPVDLAAARFLAHLSEMPGRVENGIVNTPFGPVPATGRPEGAQVIVGLRSVGSLQISLEKPGVPGRIIARRDALGMDNLEIVVTGTDRPVRIRCNTNVAHHVGQDVFVTMDPKRVLVFDAP